MCVSPTHVWVERGPKWEQVPVACRRCWRCRSNRVSDYVGRSLCEASVSDWTLALTLTYAPRGDLADKVLTPSHFQDFVRSLRRRGHLIRYLVAGEYGSLKGRAHFHTILFGRGPRLEISAGVNCHIEAWPHGHVFGSYNVDDRSLRYVCKYILKDDPGGSWFSLSKKPPLGAAFFEDLAERNVALGVLPSSFEYLPPGGQRGRPYLITGATRRDFVARLVDLWMSERPLDRARLSEWVLKAVEKDDVRRHWARIEAVPVEEAIALFAAYLDDRRGPELFSKKKVDWSNYDRLYRDHEKASRQERYTGATVAATEDQ